MTDMYSIGTSGIRAYQRALSTISVNISNAENPNYVRRNLRLAELTSSAGINPYFIHQTGFGGVEIGGISRSTDPFLEANVRLTGAALYGAETRFRWMKNAETALGDTEHGVGAKFNKLFAIAEELASAPFNSVLRNQFISEIDASVTAINRTANVLATLSGQISGAAEQEVITFNEAIENLAKTNLALRIATNGSSKQAALLDQRDAALAVLSERADVTISFADKGVANISYDGQSLVDVGQTNTLSVISGASGNISLAVNGISVTAPSRGSLSALLSSATTTVQRRTELDNLANQFAVDINAWQAAGETNAGVAGPPLLNAAGGATALTMITRDPADLALATAGGATNGNIANFSALRGSTGVEQIWTNIVGAQAIVTASAQSENAAAKAQYEAAREARDSLSSVDLDREAADLLRYQEAYNASARVIQVARENMQNILALF
ncbi:flagellar hook-associated protein FlgK [Parasphingorhabdus cellanae]|uniref:Flagellar hook-associated protein 1 n=1 Tax=Parasphingorhabdus cellanae TaxID=2806553 RepID=A0ABX7T4J3_9SPHN|nr:flagellar hook-associated protein FlgK [Parasphingorhabdus cellanae]QTD56500.1 flagellar hook-associated protein FlgK [Parasphingorhabdus cellanae]